MQKGNKKKKKERKREREFELSFDIEQTINVQAIKQFNRPFNFRKEI